MIFGTVINNVNERFLIKRRIKLLLEKAEQVSWDYDISALIFPKNSKISSNVKLQPIQQAVSFLGKKNLVTEKLELVYDYSSGYKIRYADNKILTYNDPQIK